MKVYLVVMVCRGGCDEDLFDIIGVYDSKDKALNVCDELLHSTLYENQSIDYSNIDIEFYEKILNRTTDYGCL